MACMHEIQLHSGVSQGVAVSESSFLSRLQHVSALSSCIRADAVETIPLTAINVAIRTTKETMRMAGVITSYIVVNNS